MDSKERFSNRVSDYVRFRPGYPELAIEWIVERGAAGPGRVIADVGAGTGILTRQLLASGARVLAIEPNAAMRAAAEAALVGDPAYAGRVEVLPGSAESTGLATRSVDLITAGQAFHWFDVDPTRAEFARVLKPGGRVALVWNLRGDTPLLGDYERLLAEFSSEYGRVRMRERASEPAVSAFFSPDRPERAVFAHEQRFDLEGLRGRLLSTSYAPREDDARYGEMLERLAEVFHAHAREGEVSFAYETVVYEGTLTPR